MSSILRRLLGPMVLAGALLSVSAWAVQPEVKTVPWVPSNLLIPHDTISGDQHTLKGTADVQGTNFQYTWDFGDGSPPVTGTVTNQYVIEAVHTYTGTAGDVFTARLTVEDTSTGETDSAVYFVMVQDPSLGVEVNQAIDHGLWYLHKTMRRLTLGDVDIGQWDAGGGYASNGYYSTWASNVQAFEVNGHLESGDSSNPYTETVSRGLQGVLNRLTSTGTANQTNGLGTFNPDANGNGILVRLNQTHEFYQGGMVMDAIVASNSPTATAQLGPVLGRTYGDIVQDMADYYAYCQYDGYPGGGWRYGCQHSPDGSAAQWAAIGLIAAERGFGATIPQIVKDWNRVWVDFAHDAGSGRSGYTNSTYYPWGPYATTPSGTVQMAMDGIGRGNPLWDSSEAFLRGNFCNGGGPYNAIRDYYYGLFSFTKSMLLHDPDGDSVSDPIMLLGGDLDWYGAQAADGDACDGVARTLVSDQNALGYWSSHNVSGAIFPFETSWAIIMLNRTIFASGVPVAVADANPNPAVAFQTITLDCSASFHQDPERTIVLWEWDLDGDGVFDTTGPVTTASFDAVGDYPVLCRVTDDEQTTDDDVLTVRVTTPPIAPTADANGPYVFCPQAQPWFLDGSGSVNPDEGQSEPGQTGDTIQSYDWELDGLGNDFDEAFGSQPDVTSFYTALGVGDYLAQLRTTDTTATSYPSSGLDDLSDVDSAQVSVKDAADPACGCIDDLIARAKDGKVQIVWSDTSAASYNVYRSTTSGGPYTLLANTTSTYSTYLDTDVVNGTTYYYVVREVSLSTDELCQSNEASATPAARVRRR